MSLYFKTVHDLPRVVPVVMSHDVVMPRCSLDIALDLKNLSERAIKRLDIGSLVGCIQVYHDLYGKRKTYRVGCLARVTGLGLDIEGGILLLSVKGMCRFELSEGAILGTSGDFIPVNYKPYASDLYDTSPMFSIESMQTPLFEKLMMVCNAFNVAAQFKISGSVSYDHMLNGLTMAMPLRSSEKQMVMEASTLADKEKVLDFLLSDHQIMLDPLQRSSH
jgi:Lon protease-like protein